MTIHTFYQFDSKAWCSSLIKVSFSINPFLTDFCVHRNIARYVLGCSKYFEQLKTPCLCKRLSFPPKSESPPKLRCCFYDLDGAVLFFNHSLAASVSLYFALGAWAVLDTVVQLHRPPTQGENNFLGMMYDV